MTREEAIKELNRVFEPAYANYMVVALTDGATVSDKDGLDKDLKQKPCDDTVSRGVFEQVMWERDTAIEQLRELGYELGQKIEPCDDCVSRSAVMQIVEISRLHLDRKYDTEVMSEQIKALPSGVPKREQGEWIKDDFTGLIKCSRCKNDAPISTVSGTQYESDFCQSCGAEMR